MNRTRFTSRIAVLTLASFVATTNALHAGQAVVIPLSDMVKGSSLIAVVNVTEVTHVDVSTGEYHLTRVYVAQAVVEESIKPDAAPPKKDRKIAIVGSTIPRSSAVWRPIERRRYLAFLRREQGHYLYGVKWAFREIDDNEKVAWYEYPKGGRFTGFSNLSLKKAIERLRHIQKNAVAKDAEPMKLSTSVKSAKKTVRTDHPAPQRR